MNNSLYYILENFCELHQLKTYNYKIVLLRIVPCIMLR